MPDDSYGPIKIVSKYFSDNLVMDESSKEVKKEKQSTSKKPQAKTDKTRKKSIKKTKGQKDIRTLIKSNKNELLKYSKDFDLICKQSGIDVDPEQLQLAIALSKSLEDNKSLDNGITDNTQITITEKALSCNQRRNKIRTTLQEYGFQTNSAPTKKVKRYQKNYKLLLASDTEKQQKIADRYAEILITNVALAKTNEEIGCKNNFIDSYLYNLTTNFTYDCMKNDDIFYIFDLVPKSLHEKHNLKDWSEIPGRPVSPKLEQAYHRFKDIECSQEQLDKILSGSIDTAHEIVKSNHTSSLTTSSCTERPTNAKKLLEIESRDNPAVFYDTRSIEDIPISKTIEAISYENTLTMSLPINRSCSPDLFDDEVTIIMDSSKNDKDDILMQEGISSVTVIKQNDFMELTNCIGNINGDSTVSKNIACLSQGSKPRLSSNDFMDLTECVPACSQRKINTSQSSSCEKLKENLIAIEENNEPYVIDLNQSSNFVNNSKENGIHEKSLDDTIIMIDEDYKNINTGNKINVANVCSKDCSVIDLVENECENFIILNKNKFQHTDSIIDLEGNPEFNNDNIEKSYQVLNKTDINKTIPDLVNFNSEENSQTAKDTKEKKLDTVDLTQPDYEKCLSQINVTYVQSIATYEMHNEFDGISSKAINSENDNFSKNSKDKDDGSEKCGDYEEMDLTQSSNSEDCVQEVVHKDSVNNKTSDDKVNKEYDSLINFVGNDLEKKDKLISDNIDCESLDINYETNQNTESKKSSKENNIPTISDAENDCQFDNLVKSVSKSKQNISTLCGQQFLSDNSFNLTHRSTVESDPNSQEIDLTQNQDCSRDKLSEINNGSDELENITDNAPSMYDFVNDNYCNYNYDEYNQIHLSLQGEDNDESNNQYESLSNGKDTQHSDIDLTQQSDSSEDTYHSPKIIEVPSYLGQQNNISIDYDEIYDKDNITEHYERTSPLNTNKRTENDKNGSKDDCVSGSSQQSEVFELSDNEFNYSINEHKQHKELSTLKQTEFDIGGLSIIDDFLNRKSIPNRSKLRCSCSSNIEHNANDNNVESCLPDSLDNTEDVACSNVNKESKSCEEVTFVKISTPLKSRSDDNILIAKTPRHNDYVIKTDQVTPMPNYESMTSPERNEELDKFGIKPLKRKRAIQILTHIYNQTHPLMEVINDECSSPSKIRRTNNTESFPRRAIASQIDSLQAKQSVASTTNSIDLLEVESLSQKTSKSRKEKEKSPKSSSSKENILFYEETTSIPDIRNIECSPEDWVFQKREKAKVQSCRVPLHIAFHNYVSCRKALREAILRYEPINIDDIHKGLVAIGYRYNPKDLLKFMDRKCITVKTADNSKKNKNSQ